LFSEVGVLSTSFDALRTPVLFVSHWVSFP
jgi:hypothetical protein